MYPTAHWDLVRFTVEERIAETGRPVAEAAPVTPGRITVWGPRASRRAAARLARVIRIPRPRTDEPERTGTTTPVEDALLLDA